MRLSDDIGKISQIYGIASRDQIQSWKDPSYKANGYFEDGEGGAMAYREGYCSQSIYFQIGWAGPTLLLHIKEPEGLPMDWRVSEGIWRT